jgi:hypothetical protein|tara:strand:+ start:103 stop:939 length:837 start_codon:yes stop_codon:yes gene_type:complete
MSDEQMTTESQDSPQTEQNSGSVLGSSTVGDNQNWKDTLPDELKNDPTLENYKDVESLAKTVVHQQKMMGNRIPMPKNDEEKAELYSKLGRPDEPDKYDLAIPDSHKQHFHDTALNNFKNVAHQIGLNNDQVNALIDYQVKELDAQQNLVNAGSTNQKEEVEAGLKKEWGYDFDKNLKAAQRAMQVYADDELMDLMNTEVGNNPAVIKLFARLGKDVTEDMAQNTQNNSLQVSPLDAKQEIQQIMADTSHPYFDASNPEHKNAVEHMRQLHEKAFGNS